MSKEIERPQSKQPIPEHAQCVFKGILFDVYQWEQELFDGSTTTFEKLKRVDTVSVIGITKDKNILVIEQNQPGWTNPRYGFPGGRVDEGEDVSRAAQREFIEETGYKSKNFGLWRTEQPVTKIDWAVYTFIARDCEKNGDLNTDEGESITVKEVSFEKLMDTILTQEDFYDPEIALAFLRVRADKAELHRLRDLFLN